MVLLTDTWKTLFFLFFLDIWYCYELKSWDDCHLQRFC